MQFTEVDFVRKWYPVFRNECKEDGDYSISPLLFSSDDVKEWANKDWVTAEDIRQSFRHCDKSETGYYLAIQGRDCEYFVPADLLRVLDKISYECLQEHKGLREDIHKAIMDKF